MTKPLYDPEVKIVSEEVSDGKGNTRIALRNSKTGMFLKNTKKGFKISVEQLMEQTAKKLTTVNPETGLCPMEEVIDSMVNLAVNPTEKSANASVKAAQFLKETAWGQTPKSVLDRSEETQGIKIVVVGPIANMVNKEIKSEEDRPKRPLAPSFAEVLAITENASPSDPPDLIPSAPSSKSEPAKTYRPQLVSLAWLLEQKDNKSRLNLLKHSYTADKVEGRVVLNKEGRVVSGGYNVISAIYAGEDDIDVDVEQE